MPASSTNKMALSAESEWPVIVDEMIIIDGKACNE
jgi:hypothetical protein